jgi:hypothetical protein
MPTCSAEPVATCSALAPGDNTGQGDERDNHQRETRRTMTNTQAAGAPANGTTTSIVKVSGQTLDTTNGLSNTETRPPNTYVNYLIKFAYEVVR